jgi:hypothetical protein
VLPHAVFFGTFRCQMPPAHRHTEKARDASRPTDPSYSGAGLFGVPHLR